MYGFMSYIGVPSMRSAPATRRTVPSPSRFSMPSSFTQLSPSAFGRKGERVANTPSRVFPPRRGGRTVGDQSSRTFSENCHISHRWLKSSIPRSASSLRYSGSKTIRLSSSLTIPACRGMPNFVGKSLRIRAMVFSV